jgi:hypothetical protein
MADVGLADNVGMAHLRELASVVVKLVIVALLLYSAAYVVGAGFHAGQGH